MPYFTVTKKVQANPNEIVTKKGSKSNIRLPDGTQVWLNGDTRLSYSNDFIGNTREVYLEGEAFFDVSHDAAHPFIIHTNKINIKVLGTAFNVRSYPQDETVETSLVRGKIEVILKSRPDEKIILSPNEKLIVSNKNTEPEVGRRSMLQDGTPAVTIKSVTSMASESSADSSTDSAIAETAWMNDEFAFFNQTLEQIAMDLERRFGVVVLFGDEHVKSYRYSAFFDREGVEKILGVLSLSKKFNYTMEGKKITIKK
jgi:ferric-dicitrate binding protein FerR (iron transport regulator)